MIDCVCHACGKHYSVNAPGKYLCTCGEMFSCESAGEVKKTVILTKSYRQSKSKDTKPVAVDKEVPKETVCPFCKSAIPAGAKKCAHCGEWINGKPKSKTVYLVLAILFGNLGISEFYAGSIMTGIGFFIVNIPFAIASAHGYPAGFLGILALWGIAVSLAIFTEPSSSNT